MPSFQRSFSSSSLLSQSGFGSSSISSTMSKAMKLFDQSITGAKHANTDEDILQEETGDWKYVVADISGIRARGDASYSNDTKLRDGCRYKEGTIVEVDRRRRCGWTQWLRLRSGGGWLFDVSPKDKKVRMIEVEVVEGSWQYEALAERVPLLELPAPCRTAKSRNHGHLRLGDNVLINQRVRPIQMRGSFLRLTDGRGWVMDFADGRPLMQRASTEESTELEPLGNRDVSQPPAIATSELGPPELGEWDYVVVDPKGMSLRASPEWSQGQKLPTRIEEGELIDVVERRHGQGTTYLRLAWPKGWAFDVQPGNHARLRLTEVRIERGEWHYVVSTNNGIALRSRCSFSDLCKIGQGPQKGSLVAVTQRVKIGGSTFLRIEGGWIFDCKMGKKLVEGPVHTTTPPPGTLRQVRAEPAFAVTNVPGSGEYSAPGLKYRTAPCTSSVDGGRVAPWGSIVHGEVVCDDWLKVDSRFLPFKVNGMQVLRPLEGSGVRLSSAPTDASWAVTKMVVLDKAQVQVTLLCEVDGLAWVRIAAIGGNMEGWLHQRLLHEPT